MKETFRDRTGDELTYALNSLGVGAEMAERKRVEEAIHNGLFRRSLGVIDIAANQMDKRPKERRRRLLGTRVGIAD